MTRRGTSNGNANGNSEDRRRRKLWLLETYRADITAWVYEYPDRGPLHPGGIQVVEPLTWLPGEPLLRMNVPACRCYRCGRLLVFETLTVDRIIPGCQGGTYRRNNIRPCCGNCNSETGGAVRSRSREPSKPKEKAR